MLEERRFLKNPLWPETCEVELVPLAKDRFGEKAPHRRCLLEAVP